MKAHIILYVSDQEASTVFFSSVLAKEPELNVPGMTEFVLGADTVLGLMPLTSASRLLGKELKESDEPRAELYLIVSSPDEYHVRALAAGAVEISPLTVRDWGHIAAYSIDRDGNVIAFASDMA